MSKEGAGLWESIGLEEICDIIRGLAFPTTDKSFAPSDGTIACLRTTNVQKEVEWEDLWFIPTKHVRNEAQIVRPGDILISTANSFELVGKVAQVKELPHRATLGAFISLIRPSELLNRSFVFYQLSSSDVQRAIRAMASTTTNISNVSTGKLRDLGLQVAPRSEQDRIVAEIEKQFTRLDAATTALKRVQANLKRYRASVLKAACEGRLVPTEAELARKEGRDYEPADQLLQRILRARRARWEVDTLAKMVASGKTPSDDRWKQKYKQPTPPDTTILRELPEGWTWATAEQLSDETRSITYGVIKLGKECESGIPTLRSSDVRHLFLEKQHVKKIAPEIAEPYRRTFLKGGEVLITVRGTLGGIVCVPPDCKGFNISREVAMIAPSDCALGPGIAILIAAPELQGWLLQNTSGIAYTGVNIERLKMLPIPLPPQSELDRIVNKVEEVLSVIEQARNTARESERRASRLRESVLERAFSGRLIVQNPNDQPASALLERIRAERVEKTRPPVRRKHQEPVHA